MVLMDTENSRDSNFNISLFGWVSPVSHRLTACLVPWRHSTQVDPVSGHVFSHTFQNLSCLHVHSSRNGFLLSLQLGLLFFISNSLLLWPLPLQRSHSVRLSKSRTLLRFPGEFSRRCVLFLEVFRKLSIEPEKISRNFSEQFALRNSGFFYFQSGC